MSYSAYVEQGQAFSLSYHTCSPGLVLDFLSFITCVSVIIFCVITLYNEPLQAVSSGQGKEDKKWV